MEPDASQDRALNMLKRVLGPEILAALEQPTTKEVLLNPDGSLWHERVGYPLQLMGHRDPSAAMSIVRTFAGLAGREITSSSASLECSLLLDGSRVSAAVPPIVSAPTFAIRRPASAVFAFAHYIDRGQMSREQAAVLTEAVRAHRNILVVGGTGSGKTTLVNAIIQAMVTTYPDERLVLIEDTREIQCTAKNTVQFITSKDVSMKDLLRLTLRFRPDRILVGEVRGAEALDLLMAWNTGHEGGAATIHANSAAAGLSKLTMLVSMNSEAPRAIEPMIAENVHVLVHIQRDHDNGCRVTEMRSVSGFHNGNYTTDRIA